MIISARVRSAMMYLPIALLAGSVAINLQLSSRLQAAQAKSEPGPKRGSRVSSFTIPATDARSSRTLSLGDGRPVILYHFSPACGWCERNWANINAVAHELGSTYRIVGLSTTKVEPEFLKERGASFEVMDEVPSAMAKNIGLSATPHTLVISGEGLVERSWFGAYSPPLKREIESFLHVSLPGLSATKVMAARK